MENIWETYRKHMENIWANICKTHGTHMGNHMETHIKETKIWKDTYGNHTWKITWKTYGKTYGKHIWETQNETTD